MHLDDSSSTVPVRWTDTTLQQRDRVDARRPLAQVQGALVAGVLVATKIEGDG